MVKLQTHNAVITVGLACTDIADLNFTKLIELEKYINEHYSYHELLIVINSYEIDKDLASSFGQIPNIRCLILDGRQSLEAMHRVILRESIGDFIVIGNWPDDSILVEKIIEASLNEHNNSYDYISFCSFSDKLLPSSDRIFSWILLSVAGLKLEGSISDCARYSRAAANAVNDSNDVTIPIKFLPSILASTRMLLPWKSRKRGLRHFCSRIFLALEILSNISPALLRFTALSCFMTAIGSLFYSLYVFISWIFRDAIQFGWASSNIFISIILSILFIALGTFSLIASKQVRQRNEYKPFVVTREITRSDFITSFTSLNVNNENLDELWIPSDLMKDTNKS